jgi:hypothetical protein
MLRKVSLLMMFALRRGGVAPRGAIGLAVLGMLAAPAYGHWPEALTYTSRRTGRKPKLTTRCLPPGPRKPTIC